MGSGLRKDSSHESTSKEMDFGGLLLYMQKGKRIRPSPHPLYESLRVMALSIIFFWKPSILL